MVIEEEMFEHLKCFKYNFLNKTNTKNNKIFQLPEGNLFKDYTGLILVSFTQC